MNAGTQTAWLQGQAGRIEAVRDDPVVTHAAGLKGVALIAHPHPLFGGTMDNKVVQTLARAAVASGWQTWRFNFRGVGQSEGAYDAGLGETKTCCRCCNTFTRRGKG